MSGAYYNEIDRDAVHVLRCLISDGLIAPGDVDDRSIKDIQPDELAVYTQCHFFAGAGLWSVAARLAGWPDDRPLWTGSCPCQPFSAAGRGLGTDDPRHLWPDFFRLIRACRPPVVMGEQVAGAPGYGWFDGVRADLAGEGFASRVVDIPVCAVDAPHIRQRLWWCAVEYASGDGREQGLVGAAPARYGRKLAAADQRINGAVAIPPGVGWEGAGQAGTRSGWPELPAGRHHRHGGVVDTPRLGWREGQPEPELRCGRATAALADAPSVALGDASGSGLSGGSLAEVERANLWLEGASALASNSRSGRNGSFWAGSDWLVCHDGKARRTEPGIRLLVDGMAGRVPAWRLAGNSISPVLAAEVIRAFLDVEAGGCRDAA